MLRRKPRKMQECCENFFKANDLQNILNSPLQCCGYCGRKLTPNEFKKVLEEWPLKEYVQVTQEKINARNVLSGRDPAGKTTKQVYYPFKLDFVGTNKEARELDKRVHGDGKLYHFVVRDTTGSRWDFWEKNFCMAILSMHGKMHNNEDIISIERLDK